MDVDGQEASESGAAQQSGEATTVKGQGRSGGRRRRRRNRRTQLTPEELARQLQRLQEG